VYAFDQATYYLQAIPGYILLLMPIIYGLTGESPFNTEVAQFFLYFTPFLVTTMLPTLISGNWRGIDSNKLQRDEQVCNAIAQRVTRRCGNSPLLLSNDSLQC
jgi:hypothetical protein